MTGEGKKILGADEEELEEIAQQWEARMEAMEQRAHEKHQAHIEASEDRSLCPLLDAPSRPHIDNVTEEEVETTTILRFKVYNGMSKSNSWTQDPIKIAYVERDGWRITVACGECGNRRSEPDKICPHRARIEWRDAYSSGKHREYDDLPDSWELEYDQYKQRDYSFSWAMVDETTDDTDGLF